MLLVLHGAKKNVGDYLIRGRGVALLGEVLPDQELVLWDRWRPVPRELFDRADAAVLCGGPGLRTDFYPKTFPLVDDLDAVPTPVLPLALGWQGRPVGHPERFSFDEPSIAALRTIHERIGWSGVRDDVSLKVLQDASVGDVRRSGCTAWYHVPSLGKPAKVPQTMRRVVFTPPAASSTHFRESVALMRALRKRYPKAERYCVFHRGLRPGVGTRRREALAVNAMAGVAVALGFKVVDAAFDLGKIDFYGECDLHVGYRVHAHLCFVSQRIPSVLLCEDGRGVGQVVTLGDPDVFEAGAPGVVDRVMEKLAAEERAGQPALKRAVDEIEKTWPVMRSTIEQLPSSSNGR